MSYSRRSGDGVARIPRWPAINRLATVSVVKGLDPGDEERTRDVEVGTEGRKFVEVDLDFVTPSERRSLPIGS